MLPHLILRSLSLKQPQVSLHSVQLSIEVRDDPLMTLEVALELRISTVIDDDDCILGDLVIDRPSPVCVPLSYS
jgi:hypothetical protein